MQENAILIYGARKAGTTLLQRLIDGSNLYVYPTELKIKQFTKATWHDKETFIESCHRANRVICHQFERFDHPNFATETSHRLSRVSCLRDMVLVEVEAAINSSPRGEWIGWAVKEVGGDFNVILNDWKKMFPDSRLVVIVRNPFYVSRSIFRERRRDKRGLTLKSIVKEIVKSWQVTEAIGVHLGRKDMHVVYYEDIVSDTESQMRSIARFLGIDFLPALTYPTLFGEPIVVSTASCQKRSVFNQRGDYWTDLTPSEAVLLTLIGGAFLIKNLLRGKVKFKHGIMRVDSGSLTNTG